MCDVVCQYAFFPSKLSKVTISSLQSSFSSYLKSFTSPLTIPAKATLANPSLIFFATSNTELSFSTSILEPSFNSIFIILFFPPSLRVSQIEQIGQLGTVPN